MPLCETAAGCPIEELAADPLINEYVERYLIAKRLYDVTGDVRTQGKIFEELELYEHPTDHLELETLWTKFKIQQQSNQASQLATKRKK